MTHILANSTTNVKPIEILGILSSIIRIKECHTEVRIEESKKK
jgi:hypothetical protein